MNRERLTMLRDHLAGLPDERFDMAHWPNVTQCGTACCIGGWADRILELSGESAAETREALGLTIPQLDALCFPRWMSEKRLPDAIAAIQSMLDSPDDDALPVWPSREGASA